MNKVTKQIKIAMIKKDRDDFAKYLSEVLGISRQAAFYKFTGKINFTDSDVTLLKAEIGDFEKEVIK